MKVKVRTAVKAYVFIAMLNFIISLIAHGSINKFLIVTAFLGIIYLIVTIDIYEQIQKYNRSRKILSDDGTYIEAPEFRLLYYNLCGEFEKRLDALRKGYLSRIYLMVIPLVVSALISSSKIFGNDGYFKLLLFLFMFFILAVLWNKAEACKKQFRKIYKNEVLNKFVKAIHEGLEYNEFGARERIEYIYRNSRLETICFDYLKVDDIISGQITEDTYVDLANVCAIDERRTLNDKYKKRKVFEGLFSATKCTGDIKGNIKIKRQNKSVTAYEREQKVELDNQTFESMYDVYCIDETFAYRILTPDVMESLTELGKYGFDIEISIKDSVIYTRMALGPMFEPSFLNKALDRDSLYTYYCVIKFVVYLTESVNKSLETFVS